MENSLKLNLNLNNKAVAAGVILTIAALGGSFGIYKWQAGRVQEIRTQAAEAEKVLFLRKEIKGIDTVKEDYLQYLYKDSDSVALRDMLTKTGREAGVKIASITPLPGEQVDRFVKLLFKLNFNAGYDQLGRFIAALETKKELTKIESIDITSRAGSGAATGDTAAFFTGPGEAKEKGMDVVLVVSAYSVSK